MESFKGRVDFLIILVVLVDFLDLIKYVNNVVLW